MFILMANPRVHNYVPLSKIFLQTIFDFPFFLLENQHYEKRITRYLM